MKDPVRGTSKEKIRNKFWLWIWARRSRTRRKSVSLVVWCRKTSKNYELSNDPTYLKLCAKDRQHDSRELREPPNKAGPIARRDKLPCMGVKSSACPCGKSERYGTITGNDKSKGSPVCFDENIENIDKLGAWWNKPISVKLLISLIEWVARSVRRCLLLTDRLFFA